jgi:hypothetical protein
MKIAGAKTPLTLKMDGYETLDTHLSKSEKPDIGAIVGGVFFTFPFLWTMEYQPEHIYELEPAAAKLRSSEPPYTASEPNRFRLAQKAASTMP